MRKGRKGKRRGGMGKEKARGRRGKEKGKGKKRKGNEMKEEER